MRIFGNTRSIGMLVVMVLWLVGCAKEEQPPENMLTKAELTEMLIQIHLLEAKLDNFKPKKDSTQQLFDHLEMQLFQADSIDQERYETTIKWYLDHPKDLFAIYGVVVDSLSLRAKNRDIQ